MSAPSPDNGFLIEGLDCNCDGADDGAGRCGNHDDEAEEAYWLGQWSKLPPAIEINVTAYESNDPKNPEYIERLLEAADL